MKRTLTFISLLLTLAFPNLARCELLWDNGEWDHGSNIASVRSSTVPDAWAVDDFIVDSEVKIRGLHWWSYMNNDFAFSTVDLLIMNESFAVVAYLPDLPGTRTFQENSFSHKIYTVDVAGFEVDLLPGRYFIGGRPVGHDAGTAFTGLNRNVLGKSQAYERSAIYGYPDWTPVGDILGYPDGLDVAFKVYGEPVPEPATLALFAAAGVGLTMHRRRS